MKVITTMQSRQQQEERRKTRACTECHRSKNKCVYTSDQQLLQENGGRAVCVRCIRLGKECIPHMSRQGKRKHRLSMDDSNAAGSPVTSGVEHMARAVVATRRHGSLGGTPIDLTAVARDGSGINNHSNQAQLLDLVDNSNLQQLNNSLNINMNANNNVLNYQQLLQQNGGIPTSFHNRAPQNVTADHVASSECLSMRLSRALSENSSRQAAMGGAGGNTNFNNNIMNGGSSGVMPSQQQQQANYLSNIDSAKLNMMINQLAGSGGNTNNGGSSSNNNERGNTMGSTTDLTNNELQMMISQLAGSGGNNTNGASNNNNNGRSNTMGSTIDLTNNGGNSTSQMQLTNNNTIGTQPSGASALLMLAGGGNMNSNSFNNNNNRNSNNNNGNFV